MGRDSISKRVTIVIAIALISFTVSLLSCAHLSKEEPLPSCVSLLADETENGYQQVGAQAYASGTISVLFLHKDKGVMVRVDMVVEADKLASPEAPWDKKCSSSNNGYYWYLRTEFAHAPVDMRTQKQ